MVSFYGYISLRPSVSLTTSVWCVFQYYLDLSSLTAYDPLVMERTICHVSGPYSAVCRPFPEALHCD